MMNGRNNGKKLMAVRIVAHSFEIVRPSRFLLYPSYTYTLAIIPPQISRIFPANA